MIYDVILYDSMILLLYCIIGVITLYYHQKIRGRHLISRSMHDKKTSSLSPNPWGLARLREGFAQQPGFGRLPQHLGLFNRGICMENPQHFTEGNMPYVAKMVWKRGIAWYSQYCQLFMGVCRLSRLHDGWLMNDLPGTDPSSCETKFKQVEYIICNWMTTKWF